MSKDQPSSVKRKRKFSIDPVRITGQDQASVKLVLGRITGRVPFPDDAAEEVSNEGPTHSGGMTSEAGNTRSEGNTLSEGTTHIAGNATLTGTTSEAGTADSPDKPHPLGITHPTGHTSETGITQDTGKTQRTRSATRKLNVAEILPVSPERDFQKVPNSITREMAARLFRGKSKHLYDYLWSQSRGAISPSRTVRRSRPQLLRGAGFGSMGTVERCVDFLVEVGLIKVRTIVGESEGNEYEVFTPEEVGPALLGLPPSIGITHETGITESTLKQVIPVLPETGNTGSTTTSSESEVSGGPKTSFKTEEQKLDDEALAQFASAMKQAALDLTGKGLMPADAQRWGDLAQVLVTELKIAAGRTTISSVPAFLAEHLRRRLWKKDKRQMEAEAETTEQKESTPVRKVDASKCPDCFGTGMWYPEGFDKGVAKCAHSKLAEQGAE